MDYQDTEVVGLSIGGSDGKAERACITAELQASPGYLDDVYRALAGRRLELAGEWSAAEDGQAVAPVREAEIAAQADSPRPSECLPADELRIGDRGPVDVDVEVWIGDLMLIGEVTLVPDEATGGKTYRPYGDAPDTWVSSSLLRQIRSWPHLRDVLEAVRDAACEAIR